MARSSSFGSLSWFKKRTAYLNKQFGTTYRPTILHSIYKNTGQIPAEFSQLPDPRGKGAMPVLYERAFAESLQSRFRQLAAASNYVDSILETLRFGGGYIAANHRRVYTPAPGGGFLVRETNRPATPASLQFVQSIPKDAIPLTPLLAYDLIKERAKQIHTKTKNNPHAGYKSDT